MSWGAQSRSKDAKTPSAGLAMSKKPEPGLWPVQPYSQWGTHAFRVGGMNELQGAGAGVAEIMAIGHWRSDAWLLYSRRNRPRLMQWSRRIICSHSSRVTKAIEAEPSQVVDLEWGTAVEVD